MKTSHSEGRAQREAHEESAQFLHWYPLEDRFRTTSSFASLRRVPQNDDVAAFSKLLDQIAVKSSDQDKK
jgi:hypothetical protein